MTSLWSGVRLAGDAERRGYPDDAYDQAVRRSERRNIVLEHVVLDKPFQSAAFLGVYEVARDYRVELTSHQLTVHYPPGFTGVRETAVALESRTSLFDLVLQLLGGACGKVKYGDTIELIRHDALDSIGDAVITNVHPGISQAAVRHFGGEWLAQRVYGVPLSVDHSIEKGSSTRLCWSEEVVTPNLDSQGVSRRVRQPLLE